ncbi:hypothetical protein [Burkholderia cenocepacia]|uniref:hypothetical protein n=1 Tax=Burkholderia cenocepacia TaxID=95486 RepID=UPI0013DE98A2|nr:hypothetical protein [Burkholderia cenocepacia]
MNKRANVALCLGDFRSSRLDLGHVRRNGADASAEPVFRREYVGPNCGAQQIIDARQFVEHLADFWRRSAFEFGHDALALPLVHLRRNNVPGTRVHHRAFGIAVSHFGLDEIGFRPRRFLRRGGKVIFVGPTIVRSDKLTF